MEAIEGGEHGRGSKMDSSGGSLCEVSPFENPSLCQAQETNF